MSDESRTVLLIFKSGAKTTTVMCVKDYDKIRNNTKTLHHSESLMILRDEIAYMEVLK